MSATMRPKRVFCRVVNKPVECGVTEAPSVNVIGALCDICAKYCRMKMETKFK